MADVLDIIRRQAFEKRVNSAPGGLHIRWTPKDVVRIHDHVEKISPQLLTRDLSSRIARGSESMAALRAKSGIKVRDAQTDDRNFAFIVSSSDVDRAGDVVTVGGIDARSFNRNPAVLSSHNSLQFPIAASSAPVVAGQLMTATARFPQLGVSEMSDSVVAALAGGLVRGASIGFIPRRWSFTKDPSRPMGVDFAECELLEWSVCAIPCNPSCLMLGVVDGSKSAPESDPLAPADNDYDWQCEGSHTLPLNVTDDPFDAAAAKAALLKQCSASGTISDEARQYFLAHDAKAPWKSKSYRYPFAAVTDNGIVASKTGWRQSLAAMLKADDVNDMPVTDAQMLVDRLEDRLGDLKASRARARAEADRLCGFKPKTREERLAEVAEMKRELGFD
jgi:hypothetical protein